MLPEQLGLGDKEWTTASGAPQIDLGQVLHDVDDTMRDDVSLPAYAIFIAVMLLFIFWAVCAACTAWDRADAEMSAAVRAQRRTEHARDQTLGAYRESAENAMQLNDRQLSTFSAAFSGGAPPTHRRGHEHSPAWGQGPGGGGTLPYYHQPPPPSGNVPHQGQNGWWWS